MRASDSNGAGFLKLDEQKPPKTPLNLALISDIGGPIASSTSFYYNIGSLGNGFSPTNSFGPGPYAVSRLVQSWSPSDVVAVGDLAYNSGSSTVLDASIGQYYNQFIHPYPAPPFLRDPYNKIAGRPIARASKNWPYNVYDYPNGFPNPATGEKGGSADGRNHFWGSPGNHDYGEFIGYGQVGVSPSDFNGNYIGEPLGPNSSATDLQSFVDYVTPFLVDPSLLGSDRKRLNVGSVDPSGNRGIYYSISLGGTVDEPLVEFFNLDTERLNINAGLEKWNPDGLKKKIVNPLDPANTEEWKYENWFKAKDEYSVSYDPSSKDSPALATSTSDPDNGFKQFQWLRKSLDESRAQWQVITGHHPVYSAGRWKDKQPDDHMSIPYMQRLLKALPKGSFDAYYNGHDHYYERVLEGNDKGIGLGIPFITNGNSGRNLSKKMQVPYGVSVYEPQLSEFDDPNKSIIDDLLPSAPLSVASQGMGGDGEAVTKGFTPGLYGYGFGATRMQAEDGYLLFHYEEADTIDPAIANHLADGVKPEKGFSDTLPGDWVPDAGGAFAGGIRDLAQFELSIDGGSVVGVKLLEGGKGYMASKGGNFRVEGFNIYGNNVDILRPWANTAQVNLTFSGGSLSDVELTDGGRGYELAVRAAWGDNLATSTEGLPLFIDGKLIKPAIKVPINFNVSESQYLVRDKPEAYEDFYLIADTQAIVHVQGQAGAPGELRVTIKPESASARRLLREQLEPTTYYSGEGAQSFRPRAQSGDLVIFNGRRELARGSLVNGEWAGSVQRLPDAGDPLRVSFSGDPISSYNVNFRPSDQSAVVRQSAPSRRLAYPKAADRSDQGLIAEVIAAAPPADAHHYGSPWLPADQPWLSAGPVDPGF